MRGVSLLPSRCSVVFDIVINCVITGVKFCMQGNAKDEDSWLGLMVPWKNQVCNNSVLMNMGMAACNML